MPNDIGSHFKTREPAVKKIYDCLVTKCRTFGPVEVESKQTSIHLVNRSAFAGVHPRKRYLNLEIVLSRRLASSRVDRVDQVSANRYNHRFKLVAAADIDTEISGRLREAYEHK